MRKFLLASVLCSLAFTAGPAEAYQCSLQYRDVAVLTTAGTTLPTDGAMVVAQQSRQAPNRGPRPAAKSSAGWRMTRANKRVRGEVRTIAPGLELWYADGKPGKLSLKGTTVQQGAAYFPELVAPVAVDYTSKMEDESGVLTQLVTLSTPAPADAMLMIVYDSRWRARTWGKVVPGAREVEVYDANNCTAVPEGMIEPSAGEKVTLVWVDRFGRMTDKSAPVAVREVR